VLLSSELFNKSVELLENFIDILKVVLSKSSELLDSSEHFNELGDSSSKEIKFSEDLVG
jgi:hypothetical protein